MWYRLQKLSISKVDDLTTEWSFFAIGGIVRLGLVAIGSENRFFLAPSPNLTIPTTAKVDGVGTNPSTFGIAGTECWE
jgi:hypothetical protein